MRRIAGCLVLAVVIGAVYYNALRNEFILDLSPPFVTQEGIVRFVSTPASNLSLETLGVRPVALASLALDYLLVDMQPWFFHLGNIFYHWLTACLVFLITLRLVANDRRSKGQRPDVVGSTCDFPTFRLWTLHPGLWPALCTASLWSLHPVQTEAVTAIANRGDVLAGLFFFAGFYAFLRLRTSDSGLRASSRWAWGGLAVMAYLLSLLSGETAMILPLLMICYDAVYAIPCDRKPFGRSTLKECGRSGMRVLRNHLFFALPLLVGGCVLTWYITAGAYPAGREGAWYGGSVFTHGLTIARVWGAYLWLLCWPMRLLGDYNGAFALTHSAFDLAALVTVGTLGVLFLLLLIALRHSRLVTFAGLWVFLTLLPVSLIFFQPDIMAERFLYLPSFGFCLFVAVGLAWLIQPSAISHRPSASEKKNDARPSTFTLSTFRLLTAKWGRVVGGCVLFISLLGLYGGRTIVRNRDWRDDLTFYVSVVSDNPHSVRGRLGLGYAYDNNGLPRMAIAQYEAGVRIDAQEPRLYANMGAAYHRLGLVTQAERAYRSALALRPYDATVWNNLGFLYTESQEYDEARTALEKAEQFSRGRDPKVYANFGLLYETLGKFPEALAAYRKAGALAVSDPFLTEKITALEKRLSS
jgi:protein O-mannosyl-transferase